MAQHLLGSPPVTAEVPARPTHLFNGSDARVQFALPQRTSAIERVYDNTTIILKNMEDWVRASCLALAGMIAVLPGCASIVKGSSQSINIATPPITGAICTLTNKEGSWTMTSPGSVTVEKSKEAIQVRCTKPGWQDASGIIPSDFQGWTVGNILLGGVIGIGVDAATGALHEYPNTFQVPMLPAGPPVALPPAAPLSGSPTKDKAPGS